MERRSFFSRVGAGAAAFGAAFGARDALAQTPASGSWQPMRHGEDDWLDQPAKHRLFVDTTTADAFGHAVFYMNNFYNASRTGYNLTDADSAVVIGVRHESTPFAFNDAMWAKYGEALAELAANVVDPKTSKVPTVNVFMASGYGAALANRGVTLDANLKRGMRLSVCQLATRAISNVAARRSGGNADAIYKELVDNRVPNSHMVPAGVVVLNRAQERGYSFAYCDK
jgi:hypothetical protein